MSTNASFAKGLGEGFGLSIKYLSKNVKEQVFEKAKESIQFAIGVGYGLAEGLGHSFPLLTSKLQEEILKLERNKSSEFREGLGFGLGYNFNNLDEIAQNELLSKVSKFMSSFFITLSRFRDSYCFRTRY
jgi:hypothetical protein